MSQNLMRDAANAHGNQSMAWIVVPVDMAMFISRGKGLSELVQAWDQGWAQRVY